MRQDKSDFASQLVCGWVLSASVQDTSRRLIQLQSKAFVENRVQRAQRKMPSEDNGNGIVSFFLPHQKTDQMGEALTLDSPFGEHVRSLFPLYQFFYNGMPRQIHGITHVTRVALFIEQWYELYQQYDADFELTEEELKITQLAALFHDSARADDGEDLWDNDSAAFLFTYLVADMQMPIEKAKRYCEIIANKDRGPDSHKVWRIQIDEGTGGVQWVKQPQLPSEKQDDRIERMRVLLHEADCLDIMRCQDDFEKKYLYFFKKYQDNYQAKRDLQALLLSARGVIYQMGELTPFENESVYEGFNQPSCEHIVRQLCDDVKNHEVSEKHLNDFFVRGIQNPLLLRNGVTGASIELQKSQGDGNEVRSMIWLGDKGTALFSSVGLLVSATEVIKIECNDTGSGYGKEKRSAVTAMSYEELEAAKVHIEKDRCDKKPTSNQIQINFKQVKFLPYNEVTAKVRASEINGVVFTKDPTWTELDKHSYSLLDAIYLQQLIKEELGKEVPIYEYSGLREVFTQLFANMVTEEEAINEWRHQIRRFFNKDFEDPRYAGGIEQLFETDDPGKLKSIICYGEVNQMDTLSDQLCSLSVPDQLLSQSAQDKITELVVMNKWQYAHEKRLPALCDKMMKRPEMACKLSFFDIKMLIENQKLLQLTDSMIEQAIIYFIQHDYRCYCDNNVVGSPLYKLVNYLSRHQKGKPQYWDVLIREFIKIIELQLSSPYFFSIPDSINYFCRHSGLIENDSIAKMLKKKREYDFCEVDRKFKASIPIEKPDSIHDLVVSLVKLERIFKNEDASSTIEFKGANVTFLTVVRSMKDQLAQGILSVRGVGLDDRKKVADYVYLYRNEEGVLDDVFLGPLVDKLDGVEGNEIHFSLVDTLTDIFKSETQLSKKLLMKIINSLHTPLGVDVYSSKFKLVFDVPRGSNVILYHSKQSLFNILYDLVVSDKDFMEKNDNLRHRLSEISEELWTREVGSEGLSIFNNPEDARVVINKVLYMSVRGFNDDIFLKLANIFPSGPCERLIASIEFLITIGSQSVLQSIFSSDMHRFLIKMMERVFGVRSVIENIELQNKIYTLLDKHSEKLPLVLKDCMQKAVVYKPEPFNVCSKSVGLFNNYFSKCPSEAEEAKEGGRSCSHNC